VATGGSGVAGLRSRNARTQRTEDEHHRHDPLRVAVVGQVRVVGQATPGNGIEDAADDVTDAVTIAAMIPVCTYCTWVSMNSHRSARPGTT
jgi:hypothetical protein